MTVDFKCGDPAALAGYLYDECDAAEHGAIDAHLRVCATCAGEIAALGATRTALAEWTPPEAVLGFRMTSERDTPARDEREAETGRVLRPVRWWQRPMPAWAQAAAAAVIFAAGVGLGMRTAELPATQVRGAAPATAATTSAVSVRDLAALEERLRQEMHALRVASTSAATAPKAAPASEEAVVQRVRALLAESEQRQQRELAFRLTQVLRDVDSQRTADLTRIERTFGQFEGVTRPELAQQREMINYLIRTASQRPPQ